MFQKNEGILGELALLKVTTDSWLIQEEDLIPGPVLSTELLLTFLEWSFLG